eukprot:8881561-Alexandrium_andersonii.AAC.1
MRSCGTAGRPSGPRGLRGRKGPTRCFGGTLLTAGTWWAPSRRPRALPGSPSWASSRRRVAARRVWTAFLTRCFSTANT